MKQSSFWFRLSSYFYDRVVEKTQAASSAELLVIMRNGKLLLDSGKANYSFGALHEAFQAVFKKTKLNLRKPQSTLILGFGAGSIAHILRKELNFNCHITGIEKDSTVLRLATQYFAINEIDNCSLNQIDALTFLKQDEAFYDLIVVDIFEEIDVPDEVCSIHFLNALKSRLNRQAILYFNFVVDNEMQAAKFSLLKAIFEDIFQEVKVITVMQSNRMLVVNAQENQSNLLMSD